MQISGLIALALATTGLWTANDPFVGKWKLDASRSRTVDQMKVDVAGPNTYAFKFEGGPVETIVADGTDQPGLPGTLLSATVVDAHTWKIVRKQGGKVIITAIWNLSEDGRTLRDNFTSAQPDGSMSTVIQVFKRSAAKAGFTGVWESTDLQVTGYEIEIRPYGSHGFTFAVPAANSVKNVAFDGQDHAVPGPVEGLTAAGRRPDERVLEMTDKLKGALYDTRTYRLSRDGKILTMTMHIAGQSAPNILVFERE